MRSVYSMTPGAPSKSTHLRPHTLRKATTNVGTRVTSLMEWSQATTIATSGGGRANGLVVQPTRPGLESPLHHHSKWVAYRCYNTRLLIACQPWTSSSWIRRAQK